MGPTGNLLHMENGCPLEWVFPCKDGEFPVRYVELPVISAMVSMVGCSVTMLGSLDRCLDLLSDHAIGCPPVGEIAGAHNFHNGSKRDTS